MDKTIVITRAAGDETVLSEELRERGYHVIHEPLTQIFLRHTMRVPLEKALFSDPDAVIVTSQNGVRALATLSHWRDQALLAVGEATAEIAISMGFTRVSAAKGDVGNLIGMISDAYDEGSHFVYASAEHIRVDLVEELTARGMQVQRLVMYEATAAEQFSDILVEHMNRGRIDGVTFFSQRTAEIFNMLAETAGITDSLKNMEAFALSPTIADVLRIHAWKAVHVAGEATLASLVECVDNSFHER